ncbi:uncharacterized protein LOC121296789 isoform X1 [Polyodon spathula]|uniref:uncharacterized protein LOC121296789 isoform X1 n=1 Tax=Polyodon spathula TaxID=7913 RepID=UPI001B7E7D5E|nr:uncharacterized protein LOC121296789 isoform X1 [Polyodon spathula]
MLAKFRNGNLTTYLDLENRAELFPNGTLKLALINKNDTGHYLLEVFNKEGNNILRESIHLHTQDLICTVAVEKRSRRSRSAGRVTTVVCIAGTFLISILMLILKELTTINQAKGQYVVRNNTRREEMKRYTEEQSPPFTKATELEGK